MDFDSFLQIMSDHETQRKVRSTLHSNEEIEPSLEDADWKFPNGDTSRQYCISRKSERRAVGKTVMLGSTSIGQWAIL
jgi:hypothetical protein